jgi:toxin ParE1/3/4
MPALGSVWESDHPELAGLRVLPIRGFENYLVFYRSMADRIEIVRVLHGARDLDSLLRMEP